jgi:outer membrane lipoprotein-sorting protein
MPRIDEQEILRRLELISQIEPSPEAIALAMERVRRVLVNMPGKEETSNPIEIWGTILKTRISRFAAAAVIIIGILFGLYQFGVRIDGTAAASWADVMGQIYKARTVTYRETFKIENEPPVTMETMVMEPGCIRTTFLNGLISIRNLNLNKELYLYPRESKAVIVQWTGRKQRKQLINYLDWVAKLKDRTGQFIGQNELDGQIVDVFLFQQEFEKTTVWVAPKTNLPVRVERETIPNPDKEIIVPQMTLDSNDFGMVKEGEMTASENIFGISSDSGIVKKTTTVISDFVWDANLDEALFSTEPPPGYAVEQKQLDQSDASEKDLIEVLALWAETSDGFFPSAIKDLGDPNKVKPVLVKKFAKGGNPVDELEQAMPVLNKILKVLIFAQQQKIDGEWGYAGDGIRLGETSAPICWWKSKGSGTYRVIYGDLSIGDSSEIPQQK